MTAQSINKHQWKDRLVLVMGSNPSSLQYQDQLKQLRSDPEGMEERKLKVYQLRPGYSFQGVSADPEWRIEDDLYETFKLTKSDFEVVLIGLDGGVKLRETHPVARTTLFRIIDGMPMRKAEIKSKSSKGGVNQQ